jgi:hypothetical protein
MAIKFWIWATLFLFLQESVTTSGVMESAYSGRHNLYIFTLIFFIATISEIFLFFKIGKLIQIKGQDLKIVEWTRKYLHNAEHFVGSRAKRIFLVLLSASLLPPSATSFISSWLEISFKEIFICLLLGNILWYITCWMVVLSVTFFVKDPQAALYYVLGVSLVLVLVQKVIGQIVFKKMN